jgi:hypothetical protein
MEVLRMSRIKTCFILENGCFREVPASEVIENGKYKPEFAGRYFYPFKDCLMEVSREDRSFFYSTAESGHFVDKQKRKKQRKMEIVSLDALSSQEHRHMDILQDTTDIPVDLEIRMELEQLKRAEHQLEESELQLIEKIFYENKSERQIENETGTPQRTINNRKHRVLAKLLKLMKNKK